MSGFIDRPCPIRRIGDGQRNHFFGYYNKTPWDDLGRYLLSNQVPVMTQDLDGSEVAEVGYFDLEDEDIFKVIGSTTAWNWQMGCQLQWLRTPGEQQIIYNTRAMGPEITEFPYADFRANVYDCVSEEVRELPLPIYAVARDGGYALCVNYARFEATDRAIGYRPTHRLTGFRAAHATSAPEPAPGDDGIWRMDIESGNFDLILSLRQLYDFEHASSMDEAVHWVSHLQIAPDGERFLFVHRWTAHVGDETSVLHRLFTCDVDGTNLRLLESTERPELLANPTWKDDHSVIAWGPNDGSTHYHLYDDRDGSVEVIGAGTLTENGHMTYTNDGRWILTDTYPNPATNHRRLLLYEVATGTCYMIGEFFADPDIEKHNRCDLHPRFSPDDRSVAIDSIHEGSRQQYLLDVSELTA
ncbi:MAG: hypothetical protein QNJ11_17400 [Woeseiaceae bacterium]|nr:hypothetical protein [Woeseiaceae bacterium]